MALPLAGSPLDLVQPDTMRFKVQEPVLLLGQQRFQSVDIRVRVKGGGHVSQVYGKRPSCLLPAQFCKAVAVTLFVAHFAVALALVDSHRWDNVTYAEPGIFSDPLGICVCSHPTSHSQGSCRLLPEM